MVSLRRLVQVTVRDEQQSRVDPPPSFDAAAPAATMHNVRRLLAYVACSASELADEMSTLAYGWLRTAEPKAPWTVTSILVYDALLTLGLPAYIITCLLLALTSLTPTDPTGDTRAASDMLVTSQLTTEPLICFEHFSLIMLANYFGMICTIFFFYFKRVSIAATVVTLLLATWCGLVLGEFIAFECVLLPYPAVFPCIRFLGYIIIYVRVLIQLFDCMLHVKRGVYLEADEMQEDMANIRRAARLRMVRRAGVSGPAGLGPSTMQLATAFPHEFDIDSPQTPERVDYQASGSSSPSTREAESKCVICLNRFAKPKVAAAAAKNPGEANNTSALSSPAPSAGPVISCLAPSQAVGSSSSAPPLVDPERVVDSTYSSLVSPVAATTPVLATTHCKGSTRVFLPCSHSFHASCIASWFRMCLAKNQPQCCPSCRNVPSTTLPPV